MTKRSLLTLSVLSGLVLALSVAGAPAPDEKKKEVKTVTTDSGLKYQDLKVGDGAEATKGKTVVVDYTGTLASNGKEFDTSKGKEPFTFPLGAGKVIKGWDEGVAGMKVGGKRKLIIPSKLAYGDRAVGGVIPANSDLVFEVELLEVK
jgi:FKBP-type peptidyl-prolyl cis-trans isomerase